MERMRTVRHEGLTRNCFSDAFSFSETRTNLMQPTERNRYAQLCTELYEILHPSAPPDELDFYLSYAKPHMRILEPMCGSGRFLIPFLERGFDICGMDSSPEMLAELSAKEPRARTVCADLLDFHPTERFDLIFVTSGSISLFTEMDQCRRVLASLRNLLANNGVLVFAVDAIANRCPDDADWRMDVSAETRDGFTLTLKTKNRFDEATSTQFMPGNYELHDGDRLLRTEMMDFQTHLYRYGEMEEILDGLGFSSISAYSSFAKTPAASDADEMFLFECR